MTLQQVCTRIEARQIAEIDRISVELGKTRGEVLRALIAIGLRVDSLRGRISTIAQSYELDAQRMSCYPQRRHAPEEQLARLKARHWRILEKAINDHIEQNTT